MNHWSDYLKQARACPEAVQWARRFKTPATAWRALDNGDWLDWFLNRAVSSKRHDIDDWIRDNGWYEDWWFISGYEAATQAVKRAFPVPNLDDLKAMARGEVPWELP